MEVSVPSARTSSEGGGGEEERRESRGRRNGKEENVSGIDRPWNDRHVKFGFRWKRAQVK